MSVANRSAGRLPAQKAAHLLCSVGTAPYHNVVYRLGKETHTSRFAPVAVARLLGLVGGRASVLVTHQARDRWFDELAAELRAAGLEPEPVHMPEARTEAEILDAFHRVVETVEQGEQVVLDVTFSLRHLPFVYLAALTYLTAYRDVTIEGIYYGAFELKPQPAGGIDEVPVVDITALVRLVEWYHGVQTARKSGDLRIVAEMMRGDVATLFKREQGDPAISRASNNLGRLAAAVAAGLPLEVGIEAQRLAQVLSTLERSTLLPPAAHLSLGIVTDWLELWETSTEVNAKGSLTLSEDELRRQWNLAEWYFNRGDLPKTLLLLREWLVSLLVLRRGDPARWLERGHREVIARSFGVFAYRARHGLATPAEKEAAGVWDGVAHLRNLLAHAGMTKDEVKLEPYRPRIQDLLTRCREMLNQPAQDLPQLRPGSARLLVTPLGLTPGVVFSAVTHTQPDRVVVVTSADARLRLQEALDAAGSSSVPRITRALVEPHTGFREATTLIDLELREWLAAAGEVVVNLSGGTTVIQYVVERIAEEAQSLGVPVRRVAMVDRRPFEEQRDRPYVLGELVHLDDLDRQQDELTIAQ